MIPKNERIPNTFSPITSKFVFRLKNTIVFLQHWQILQIDWPNVIVIGNLTGTILLRKKIESVYTFWHVPKVCTGQNCQTKNCGKVNLSGQLNTKRLFKCLLYPTDGLSPSEHAKKNKKQNKIVTDFVSFSRNYRFRLVKNKNTTTNVSSFTKPNVIKFEHELFSLNS